jgi:hypothetical protein
MLKKRNNIISFFTENCKIGHTSREDYMEIMKYKDYYGSVNYSDKDGVFYGKLEGIRDLVSYEGQDLSSLRTSFEEIVDDYLDFLSGDADT